MKKWQIVLFLILHYSCNLEKNIVYFENIPHKFIKNENRFDLDNKVYPINREIIYQCTIANNEQILDVELKFIRMMVQGTTKPFSDIDPDYSQTVIKLEYLDHNREVIIWERTGLVENNINIWLHPPRDADLDILQLSAFPYIKLNNIKNWKWKLNASYGSHQNVHLTHYYKKLKSVIYKSELGSLNCVPVNATTESRIGTTNSEFLYHNKLGFVKMRFYTIENTTITLDMINGEF